MSNQQPPISQFIKGQKDATAGLPKKSNDANYVKGYDFDKAFKSIFGEKK